MEPYYKTVAFQILIGCYFFASVVSAIFCYITAKKYKLPKLEWTFIGYIVPGLSVLFIRRKVKHGKI